MSSRALSTGVSLPFTLSPRLVTGTLLLLAAAACGSDEAATPGNGEFTNLPGNVIGNDAGTDSGAVSGDGDGDFPVGDGDGDVGAVGPDGGVVENADAGDGDAPADAGGGEVDDGPFLDGALCHLEANQVGLVGDSYIHLSGKITADLQASARAAGAIGPNDVYLDHALSGASLNGFPSIPTQWPDVLADAERRGSKGVKLVVATGGGNDVLVNNRQCLDFPTEADMTDQCKQVVSDAVTTGTKLFEQAGTDGVEAIIYFFYPHLPKDSLTGLQGAHPNTMLDYAYPLVKKMCDEQVKPRCFFIDTRPPFEGKQDVLVTSEDGIHPTAEGSKIIADMIWDIMQTQCIASM